MITRRRLLASVAAAALIAAQPALGASVRLRGSPAIPIGTGWNVLPLGCGGFVVGAHMANDGKMIARTDVGNAYRWSGTASDFNNPAHRWEPLLSNDSLGSGAVMGGFIGAWEMVHAPNNSNILVAIFNDDTGLASYWIWYSTNRGTTWTKSNISIADGASSNTLFTGGNFKIAVDPANQNIAYAGMPAASGNPAGTYTTLNKAGGSSLATWTSVKTSGSTPIPSVTNGLSSGIVIDANSGTTTIGGQTVTNRIIIPVGGRGIYESTDGGDTFTETAVATFGGSNFYVAQGFLTADGVYYCIVVNSTFGGIWRYASGTWTNITNGLPWGPTTFDHTTRIIVDPRNNPTSKAYLSVYGPNGMGQGFTATNANTASTPNWNGSTHSQFPYMFANPSYDIGYINTIFGQREISAYLAGNFAIMDPNTGYWFWGGNQSFFYFATSSTDETAISTSPPNYAEGAAPTSFTATTSGLSTSVTLTLNSGPTISAGDVISGEHIPPETTIVSQSSGSAGGTGVYVLSTAVNLTAEPVILNAMNVMSWSMGRGMEATVAQDVVVPPGGNYPVLAVQDLGAPMRGTFTTYPTEMYAAFLEYTCENIEFAASDPSFVVARVTDQGAAFADVSGYSESYGADGTWVQAAGVPTPLWQAQVTATISNGSGGAGTILNVTAVASGTLFPFAYVTSAIQGGGTFYGRLQPYGTDGTTGTGGTGTYKIDGSFLVASGTIHISTPVQAGQTVAVDADHWVTTPTGLGSITVGQWVVPAYTTNRGATWQLCSGIPASGWMLRPWSFGVACKPFAVGYGVDLGTVWACAIGGTRGDGTARLYRSTDSGATFSQIASWTADMNCAGVFCLSMPDRPNELWVSGNFSGGTIPNAGIWHITNANTAAATVTAVNLPAGFDKSLLFTLGAPATPGGYPTLFVRAYLDVGANAKIYRGSYPGTGSTVTWTQLGPTGLSIDLPAVCQLQAAYGMTALAGDWSAYGRLYAATGGCGFAYYNP